MDIEKQLLSLLDQSVADSKFPFWELGEENNLVFKMRVSGWHSSVGIGLLFEVFGYNDKECLIQNLAMFFPTFKTEDWIKTSNIFLDRTFFMDNNNRPDGQVKIMDKLLYFTNDCISGFKIQDRFKVPLSIILSMSIVFPDDLIFTSVEALKTLFKMPDDSKCLFHTQRWKHLSFEDYWEKGKSPSKNKDFIEMARVLSQGENKFSSIAGINSSWGVQSKKIKN